MENRGPDLFGVDLFFLLTAVIASMLRCYVRANMVKAFGLDDWLMFFAMCSFICYCSFSIAGVRYGTGHHFEDLELQNIEKAMKCWWFCYLFYCISMISSKISIGWFLLRITVKKVHAWIIYAAMTISVLAGVVFFFVTLFQCHPISHFWNKSQTGRCINIDVIIGLAYLYSVFSIISDFTFAILPGFLIWNLQLKRRTKLALVPLLAMGCIASAAVVVRLGYLPNFRNPDFLWATLDIAIWSTIEQGLAITAGSLATLRPLCQLFLYKLGLSTKPTDRRPSNYGIATPPSGHALSSRRKGSLVQSDYPLPTFAKLQEEETEHDERDVNSTLPAWYPTSIGRVKSPTKTKMVGINESEEDLRPQGSKRDSETGVDWMPPKHFLNMDA